MDFQIPLIVFIQSHLHPAFDSFFKAVTFWGGFEGVVLLWSFFIWAVSYSVGCRLILLTQLVQYFSSLWIKSLVALPRPYQTFPAVVSVLQEKGFAFPSGHALNGLLYWGFLASFAKKKWVTLISIIAILLIGLSRVYLGVHYPTDVLGAWLLGGVALWIFWRLEPKLNAYFGRLGFLAIIFWILSVILFFTLLLIFFAPPGVPLSWGLTTFSITLGFSFGWLAKNRWLVFEAGGPLWMRVLRLVVGNAILMPVLFHYDSKPPWVFAFSGFWLTFGGPLLFQSLGLVEKTKEAS